MIPSLIPLFFLFLCWGSFLNVVGYRIIRDYSLTGRSRCPHCRQPIAWYDMIPVISWLVLWGRCRSCHNCISLLYPFIELATATTLTLMIITINKQYWPAYGIFISALMVTIRSDFEKMLISRYVTWCMIPLAFAFTLAKMLPITPTESIMGTLFGGVILWLIAHAYRSIRGIDGLGRGDVDLLAMIGSFTGILGAWTALFIGSFLGVIVGILLLAVTKRKSSKIAFGPWLSAGAIIYIFFQKEIIQLFFLHTY